MCIHFRSKRSAYYYGERPKRIKIYSYYTFPQTKRHKCGFEEYIKPFISLYSSPRKQNDEAFFIQSDKTFRLRVRMRTFTTDCLSFPPLVYSSTQQLLWMVPMLLHLVVYSSRCTHWRSHKMCPVICKHYIMAIFFTFWLRILATVPPDWVKLVLKAISYVTASFCIQFAIPLQMASLFSYCWLN